ncbi:MAG: hypothetical protein ACTSU2_07865 [Promethearchaeota archaeon]
MKGLSYCVMLVLFFFGLMFIIAAPADPYLSGIRLETGLVLLGVGILCPSLSLIFERKKAGGQITESISKKEGNRNEVEYEKENEKGMEVTASVDNVANGDKEPVIYVKKKTFTTEDNKIIEKITCPICGNEIIIKDYLKAEDQLICEKCGQILVIKQESNSNSANDSNNKNTTDVDDSGIDW